MISSKSNRFPNAPFLIPNTITLGIRASTYKLGVGRKHSVCNIHYIHYLIFLYRRSVPPDPFSNALAKFTGK